MIRRARLEWRQGLVMTIAATLAASSGPLSPRKSWAASPATTRPEAAAVNRSAVPSSAATRSAAPRPASARPGKASPIPVRAELLQLFGWANEFKEGDLAIGVSAPDAASRAQARERLGAMMVADLDSSRFVDDEISRTLGASRPADADGRLGSLTVAQVRDLALSGSMTRLRSIAEALSSEAIAAVAKLMTNEQLIAASARLFNTNPGSELGAAGHFGSRIQPNSPTDDPEEVLFSVLEGFSYGCGDAVLGINPVASDHANVKRLEEALRDVVKTFHLENSTKYCVLAHIDDQMAVNEGHLVNVAFQSIGGTEKTNRTFNVDVPKLQGHLSKVDAMYFETGQGSSFTNRADEGVDMVTLESRAYGLARALIRKTKNWCIVNDVAGFIGPEVFRTAAQLERACLEDLFMGKMHGLIMGLDICSTYHMGVDIDELDRIMDTVLKAGPAYLMAVAGKSDPMLSYITTGYRDHPRLRARHGKKVTGPMAAFFRSLGVMDSRGQLTDKAGDTAHVYVEYRRRKGDRRPVPEIRAEATRILAKLQARDLDLGHGHDGHLNPPAAVKARLVQVYADAKKSLRTELTREFYAAHADALVLSTQARDREDYIAHPPAGEVLAESDRLQLEAHRRVLEDSGGLPDIQVVLSDGLNADSLTADGQVEPFLTELRRAAKAKGWKVGTDIIVRQGRVRAGYQVGQVLFGGEGDRKAAVVHVIGERPGNGKNTYSAYVGCVSRTRWKPGINHDVVRVISGISTKAIPPARGAGDVMVILNDLFGPTKQVVAP